MPWRPNVGKMALGATGDRSRACSSVGKFRPNRPKPPAWRNSRRPMPDKSTGAVGIRLVAIAFGPPQAGGPGCLQPLGAEGTRGKDSMWPSAQDGCWITSLPLGLRPKGCKQPGLDCRAQDLLDHITASAASKVANNLATRIGGKPPPVIVQPYHNPAGGERLARILRTTRLGYARDMGSGSLRLEGSERLFTLGPRTQSRWIWALPEGDVPKLGVEPTA